MQEDFTDFINGFFDQLVTLKGIASAVALLAIDFCALVLFLKASRERKFCQNQWTKRFSHYALVADKRVIPVENSEILLGRHRSADIQFPDLSVSRYHAVLTFSDGKLLIDDLNSKSGTYVNGKRIKSAVLKINDEVRLGAMIFYIKRVKEVENG
ncbi:MAG: FHA domain-containing protein [Oscillospiraceae bacterium]|nr:FHA domain-containing protein [Oscillospiraceae bacterium]